ncbi:MAG: hypothetical protein LBQ28_06985 [Prevotellaceae bacterium]|jgi:nitrite reductase/ring-hydroxylating ferredoxin subunit|nr:hypothetical protein [Prevotellaceae bacterium]
MEMKFIFFLTFLFLLCSCGESKYENNIPHKDVYFIVYPLTDFNKALTSPGRLAITNSCTHNGGQSCGYKDHGIIVCRMMSSDTYAAYAATCPSDLTKLQIVNDAVLKVKCSKCGSAFELDNNGLSGNKRLLRYRIQMSVTNQYFIVKN